MQESIFTTADILLPHQLDLTAYSVVACDQFTSESNYWESVRNITAGKATTLQMIFPEIELKDADFNGKISSINQTMHIYLKKGYLKEEPDCFIYLERTLRDGSIRRGLVGKVDLEGYDYTLGSQTPIRATEGTVLDRIPPRVQIRMNAPIELPHVMLLIDDKDKTVLESIAFELENAQKVYDFTLMQDSGKLTGWRISDNQASEVSKKLNELAVCKYNHPALQYAVGDGNHSLATAKQCFENLKSEIGLDAALSHPARYALCEVVNLHDDSLQFEAIHRILFDIDTNAILTHLKSACGLSKNFSKNSQPIAVVLNGVIEKYFFTNPLHTLPVGTLQLALDEYLATNNGEIDYIHGDDVVLKLSLKKNSIGFILDDMDKNDLFKTVILDGALPRKTFSMGHAWDKRFYLEGRKIM